MNISVTISSLMTSLTPPNLAPILSVNSLLFLDGMRGLAALYVVIGHARWLLWEGYETGYLNHTHEYSLFDKLLVYALSLFRYGHQAVMLFFVLSGFVIHFRYAKKIKLEGEQATFDFLDFFIRRIKRIYPPLLMAILLTYLLDHIGYYLKLPIYLLHTPYTIINESITSDYSLATLAGNLCFLMKMYVPVWGTNGPLWSLAYEWWFYMIYPIFFLITRKSVLIATIIMLGLFILTFFPGFWYISFLQKIFGLMLSWWFGVLLADIYTKRINISYWLLSGLMGLLILLPSGGLSMIQSSVLQDTFWALGFVGVFAFCFWLQTRGVRLWVFHKLKFLGDISYTLYISHLPLIVLMSGFLMQKEKSFTLPKSLLYTFAGVLLCLMYSCIVYWVAERPFIRQKESKSSNEKKENITHLGSDR